jgi:hypothetical protein
VKSPSNPATGKRGNAKLVPCLGLDIATTLNPLICPSNFMQRGVGQSGRRLFKAAVLSTCDRVLRDDARRHGSGAHRRKRSQPSGRTRNRRDRAHSSKAGHSSRSVVALYGNANDLGGANTAFRDSGFGPRRTTMAVLRAQSNFRPVQLKRDWQEVLRLAEA